MICPFYPLNKVQHQCNDYYITHKGIVKCRLKEWKKRRKICPYDKNIFSTPRGLRKAIKNKEQTRL